MFSDDSTTVVPSVPVSASLKRPMTMDDLLSVKRHADPQLSPDGQYLAYVVTTVHRGANKTKSTIWICSTAEGNPRRLTSGSHPRFSPDSRTILFQRSNQLWLADLADGSCRPLTKMATGATEGIWSPDGRSVAFVSEVYPHLSALPYAKSNRLHKKQLDANQKNPVKARVFTGLFMRHWTSYFEGKRQHIFVMPLAAAGESSVPRDLTPGELDSYPTSSTFSSGDDFCFSPNGQYLLYTAPPAEGQAWSTNYNIWRVPVSGGKPECLTADNPAACITPRFSPDGSKLAYRAQRTPGFEADQWQIMVAPTDRSGLPQGAPASITADSDISAQEFLWLDDEALLFVADHQALVPIFAVNLTSGSVEKLPYGHANSSLTACLPANQIAFVQSSTVSPAEIFLAERDAKGFCQPRQVTQPNAKLLDQLDLPAPESVYVPCADGTQMHMWLLKPPGFDQNKKWPLVFLVHGGPQGAWEDAWSFRWNPEMWAAQGYVVALPNPRGSTGFGQDWVNAISRDWGGKVYKDLLSGISYLERQPFIDRERMAAAGASFGAYMMNWFQGHTRKFKTLISHCGIYNYSSMYGTTDELWFEEWEHGGKPWENPHFLKHSPHRFAKRFQTPMLIIQNDLDFRCPVSEGWQLFTTLQRLGIEAKLVNFPDEGHWVLKPANSAFWHEQVFTWLKQHAAPGGLPRK